ncbi:hypothetical protein ABVT39_009785 [Epinephelus coioides]
MANNDGDAASSMDTANLALEITNKVAAMMEEKLSVLSSKLDLISNKIEQNSKLRIVSPLQRIVTSLEAQLTDAKESLIVLTRRMDDQEARSHRDNLRIFGVKEGTEGKNPLIFFETWLPKVLNLEAKNGRIRLDRCHRGLGKSTSDKPRVVIIKLHHPADKVKILAAFNAKPKLKYGGLQITIRQDIPPNIQQQRSFNAACQQLIAKNIRFRMQYPATLHFTYEKRDFSFNSADEAMKVVETIKLA